MPSLFIILLLLFGCNTENSGSGDAFIGAAADSSTPEGERTVAALAVMSSRCLSCHPTWSGYQDDSAFLGAGLVSNNWTDSRIYQRLHVVDLGLSGGSRNMPATTLSEEDGQTIIDWLQNNF